MFRTSTSSDVFASNSNLVCKECAMTHRIPADKGSLMEISEMLTLHTEGLKELCSEHEKELRNKLRNTIDWMQSSKGWTKEAIIALLNKYRNQALEANRPRYDSTDGEDVSDIQIDSAAEADKNRRDEEDSSLYEAELEAIMLKSMARPEAKLHWYKARIEFLTDELKLHDKIQDHLDTIPEYGMSPWLVSYKAGKHIRACFQRIDTLKKEGKLSYEGLLIFNNQLLEKIGRDTYEMKYEVRNICNKISYYQNKVEEMKQTAEMEKSIVVEMKLEAEGYIELLQEIEEFEAQQVVICG